MQVHALEGGFVDAPVAASHAFRAVMTAMARPGEIVTVQGALPPAPLSPAAGAVMLTLCDTDTPVFLGAAHDTAALRDWITFHTGAPLVNAAQAAFAFGTWDDLPLEAFAVGSAEYPDRSTTVIVETDLLENTGATLRGPGIKEIALLSLPQIDVFAQNTALFPLGLDFIFTCGTRLAALPRSTRVG
jgi:alpha-D-ribose 1-methylphosphonate 5-triphosphate synthase subunit PhnH